MSKYDPALERARQNSRRAASSAAAIAQNKQDMLSATSSDVFNEASKTARCLADLGHPGVQLISHMDSVGFLKREKRVELAGWLLFNVSRPDHPLTGKPLYLLSDGRIQLYHRPMSRGETGFFLDFADEIKKALQELRTLHAKE